MYLGDYPFPVVFLKGHLTIDLFLGQLYFPNHFYSSSGFILYPLWFECDMSLVG